MALNKTDIYVYADCLGMEEPQIIGILSAQQAKGKKAFSFQYDKIWLKSGHNFLFDPDISLYSGAQYPNQKENFGVFLDSMPDTWGRTLMKRKAAQEANEKKNKNSNTL
jgi:serine/threonine-protein kinase HipA